MKIFRSYSLSKMILALWLGLFIMGLSSCGKTGPLTLPDEAVSLQPSAMS